MKKLILASLIALISVPAFAQKYGQDSVKCVENLSLYRDYYKQKMYDDAYKYWNNAFKICPASSERMYVDGTNLVEYKMKKAESNEAKSAYFDTLMMVYDQRIENFGKEGYVLGRKGTDMLRYKSSDEEAVFNTLKKSIEMQGNESEAGAIVTYMNAAVLMERAEKKTPEEIVVIFTELSDFLSYNLTKYEGKKTKTYYDRAQESVEKLASPYLSCEVLIEMANKNFESKKDDADWMERTANLLDQKGCTDAEIFFKIAKKLHSESPSAVSAEKMGILSLKNKNYSEAADYFKQAIEMAEEEKDKGNYYIELAQAYSSMGSYSNARVNARKAAEVKPNYGLPYIMIGDMVNASASSCKSDDPCLQKAIYWLAVDYYTKAKSVDPSIAEKANQKIAQSKKYFPTQQDCFFKAIKEGDSVEIGCWIGESTKARF
jgi:tetratricopeptide (TPR) repeat protein